MITQVISRVIAKPFIEQHHYSKSIGQVSIAFGLYDEDRKEIEGMFMLSKLVGVITYGLGATSGLPNSIFEGGNHHNCWELLRMAVLDDVTYPRSQFIAWTIKYIKKNYPDKKCLVSFADKTRGHYGYVYQASNWLYTGTTGARTLYFNDGKRIHNKRVSVNARKMKLTETEFIRQCGWDKVKELPKFRYIYPLDKGIKIKLDILPYPKEGNTNVAYG